MDMTEEIIELEKQIYDLKQKLSVARRRFPKEPVKEYRFVSKDGQEMDFSSLFGEKQDLLVVHNMGHGCPYCTLWADGFTGFLPHLENRAAFVVVSPDAPDVQSEFAAGRGWQFRMVSDPDRQFTGDMGYLESEDSYQPGVSAFHRDEQGNITRVGNTWFGPGDDFCSVWPFFDLLSGGGAGWEPRYAYSR